MYDITIDQFIVGFEKLVERIEANHFRDLEINGTVAMIDDLCHRYFKARGIKYTKIQNNTQET